MFEVPSVIALYAIYLLAWLNCLYLAKTVFRESTISPSSNVGEGCGLFKSIVPSFVIAPTDDIIEDVNVEVPVNNGKSQPLGVTLTDFIIQWMSKLFMDCIYNLIYILIGLLSLWVINTLFMNLLLNNRTDWINSNKAKFYVGVQEFFVEFVKFIKCLIGGIILTGILTMGLQAVFIADCVFDRTILNKSNNQRLLHKEEEFITHVMVINIVVMTYLFLLP